jgi:hypothetical protein
VTPRFTGTDPTTAGATTSVVLICARASDAANTIIPAEV